jgi:hypothetical protein
MYFQVLHQRFLALLRARVRGGELTERGLARLTGVSQPHVHNVLNGVRILSPILADQMLRHLKLTVFDLCAPSELSAIIAEVPVFRSALGPGQRFGERALPTEKYLFPLSLVAGLSDPIAARLAFDRHLGPQWRAGDLVLLDRSEILRQNPDVRSAYVVDTPRGALVRYIRREGRSLYLAAEDSLRDPARCELIPLAEPPERNILEIVRARIVWMGRQMEPSSAEPPQKAG